MEDIFARTRLLVGQEGLDRLAKARVALFGVGGVGSYAAEALARSGVGRILLVDNDRICPSNINRQLHATLETVGEYKTHVMARRMASINPQIQVETREAFCLPDNLSSLLEGEFDYAADAVDTVAAKIALAEEGARRSLPVISAMGAGNKLNPGLFRVADIYETDTCPLCRVMRRELRKRGIPSLKVVYSREEPLRPLESPLPPEESANRPKRQTPGSVSFVPPVAGLILAGEIIRDLLGLEQGSSAPPVSSQI